MCARAPPPCFLAHVTNETVHVMIAPAQNWSTLRAVFPLLIAVLIMTALAVTSLASSAAARATHFKLDNGMQVVVIPDRRAPVVTHMVWYRVGAADEPPGVSGIAHFLEHLMFKGTETIAPGEFSKIVARNGGQDNAFTSHDMTAYFQRVAKDRLPKMMQMEADRMVNLTLDEKDVATERNVVLEERRTRVDNDPSTILGEQLTAAFYQSHPYGTPIIGWEHEIRVLDREAALRFYERFYAPNNAILVVAGDVEPDEVKALAKKTYGKLKPNPEIAERRRPQEPPRRAPVRVELEDPRAGKPTFQRLYMAPAYSNAEPGEAEALDLLMKIAASGTTSRLYRSLVVEQKKASTTGGWYSGSNLDSGRIAVYAIAAEGVPMAELEDGIEAVLAKVREEGVTQRELDRARNAYIADYTYGLDSQTRLARRYGWALTTGRTVEDIEAWPERLEKVTVEDIKRVAEKYLVEKKSATGILLPLDDKAKKATNENAKRES